MTVRQLHPFHLSTNRCESSYKGSGRLAGKKAIITGGDSGIGRAVALALAREGADVLISYYNEHHDAAEARRLVESAGRKCVLVSGDIGRARAFAHPYEAMCIRYR
jgi:NAD(P)-dependent dehydrogenase (short-subunit alcohol dehydrogenase family)